MGRLRSLLIPGIDKQLLVRDATRVMPDLARRRFIAGGASFGALTLLTGCNVSDSFSAEEMLKQISKFNDGVQAAIFNPYALAPTFPESAITKPFPFNAYYEVDDAPNLRRGLERDRKLDRHAVARFSQNNRRRHPREILLVPVCGFRRLQLTARHGHRAASADPDVVQIRRRNPAPRLWFSDEDPGADKTRLQESEICDLDGSHQRLQGRLLGRPGLQFVQRKLNGKWRVANSE